MLEGDQYLAGFGSHLERKPLIIKTGKCDPIAHSSDEYTLTIGYIKGDGSHLGKQSRDSHQGFSLHGRRRPKRIQESLFNATGLTLPGANKSKQSCFE
jgi:hypothetical protein